MVVTLGNWAQPSPPQELRAGLYADEDLRSRFSRAWSVLDPQDLVTDPWDVPAYLRRSAPWLSAEEAAHLRRDDPRAWTTEDLPLLADQRAYMDDVVSQILDADDDPDSSFAMLRGDDLRRVLLDGDALPSETREPPDGPFSHTIVDEAQESPARWTATSP